MPVTKSGSFNGTTSSMSVANYTGNATSFSVSVWVYLNANQTTRTIFSDYQATGPKGWNVGIDNTTNNKLKFFLGSNTLNSVTLLANTTWYHLVFTYDGTTAKIYINGSSTPDNSLVSALVYTTVPANNYIGSLVGASEFFNGLLGAVGYWSKALSTTEIANLYNSGKGLAFADLSGSLLTSLVSYHDFLNSGSQGLDSTANAHNFTATNVTQAGGPVSGNIRVSQMGVLVVDTANPNIRMSQVGVLIVDQGTPNVRLSQFGLSVIYTANPNVRVSQSGILTIYTVTPKVRDSQIGALVVATGSPKVRDSQIGLLVITSNTSTSLARISQEGTVVVYQGTPKARISQEGVVTVYQGTPKARISQMGTLVIWQASVPDLYDDFNDTVGTLITAHTSNSGHTWSVAGSSIVLDGSGAVYSTVPTPGTPAGYQGGISSWIPPSADYSVSITLGSAFRTLGTGGWAGLTVRASGVTGTWSSYEIWFYKGSPDSVTIVRSTATAGSFTCGATLLAAQNLASQVAAGDTLTVRIQTVVGVPDFRVFHNQTQIFAGNMSDTCGGTLTAPGSAGLFFNSPAGSTGTDLIRSIRGSYYNTLPLPDVVVADASGAAMLMCV